MLCLRKLDVTYVGDVDLNELANLEMLEELTIVGEKFGRFIEFVSSEVFILGG